MPTIELDKTVPALVLKLCPNVVQHGALGIIRSLGRLGVPVYARVEDRVAPAAMSRYLSGAFIWENVRPDADPLMSWMATVGERLGRRTILVPTDDLAAAFVAEHAEALDKWFLFPKSPRGLPRRLANKKDLYFLCRSMGMPCPETVFPSSVEDVHEFIERATFPVVVKPAEAQLLPVGFRRVSIAHTATELLAIYRQAESQESPNLILQEHIPSSCAEDWVFNGYCNPKTDCFVVFTGRKLRSYPPFAGFATLGAPVQNEPLNEQSKMLLRTIGYSGVMDIDYRLDKRDGQYKLLDLNPRVGANFRMFEDRAGLDVVRALHLDLTGRSVRQLPMVEDRTFIVESYDLLASLGYMRRGGLTVRAWWQSLKGSREFVWFHWDDPVPGLTMCVRLLLRAVGRGVERSWAWVRLSRSRPGSGHSPQVLTSKTRPVTDS
jgi:D-aspartate ligase